MTSLFRYPNPVNEVAARVVAGVVALVCIAILVFHLPVLLIPLAYGFIARVATGATLSPLAQLAGRVVAPRIARPRPVPGPPKRFAQGMGAVMSTAAAALFIAGGGSVAVYVLTALIAVAATLESVFALCIGCRIFNTLMRLHVIPESVCAECADITLRRRPSAS